MDINKEREAFEAWFESRYDAHFMQFALDLDLYVDKHTQTCWEAWQAAKAESHKSASLYQWEINHLAAANQQWRDYAAKAQAVPEEDAVIKKLSDQLYEQEMKTSAARVLCETACELLDDYAHQDAMVILNDLEQAMKEPTND